MCRKSVWDIAAFEKLDTKDKRRVTLAPSDRPPNAVVSDGTQRDSLTTPHTERVTDAYTATGTDMKIKPDASAKPIIHHPPSTGQYTFNV